MSQRANYQREAVNEPRYMIVTPKQYRNGYLRIAGDGFVIQYRYQMVRSLADGNYIVVNPRASKPSAKR